MVEVTRTTAPGQRCGGPLRAVVRHDMMVAHDSAPRGGHAGTSRGWCAGTPLVHGMVEGEAAWQAAESE